jgi:hypothetical protein
MSAYLTGPAEYATSLLQRAHTGIRLTPKPGVLEGWSAQAHQCHSNAVEWCKRCSGYVRVPGWLYFSYGGALDYVRFAAHSVVKAPTGELCDITPSELTVPYPFIVAAETEAKYDEVVQALRVQFLDFYVQDGRVQVHTSGP